MKVPRFLGNPAKIKIINNHIVFKIPSGSASESKRLGCLRVGSCYHGEGKRSELLAATTTPISIRPLPVAPLVAPLRFRFLFLRQN